MTDQREGRASRSALAATIRAQAEQIARLEKERDFLLARADAAGSVSFRPGRWTGVSSNALVTIAFGGEAPGLPSDSADLAACYRTMQRLPAHLRTPQVWAQLERGEIAVGPKHVEYAREAAAWDRQALEADRG